jgi:hypothetical protein
MLCKSRWHSRQSTFRQDVESLPIGVGVGGTRKVGGAGGKYGAICVIDDRSDGSDDGIDCVNACRNRYLNLFLALSKL